MEKVKVGILGAGAMGTGIAQVAAMAGHQVLVYDSNVDALRRSEKSLQQAWSLLVSKGKLQQADADTNASNIQFVNNLYAFRECGLLIEAIIEDLQAKTDLLEQLEEITPKNVILASNTSSLSIASIAAGCDHPERVLGIHFFNPAPIMQLVEIIPAVQTDPDVVSTARAIINSWGKVTVMAQDTPGFIVNRVARPFYGEALRILEEGIADAPTIDWAMTQLGGFKMGPFTLMDFIGHDVNYTVTETVFKAFYFDPRYKPSFRQKRLVEAGYLGKKAGRGFYNYEEGAPIPTPSEDPSQGQIILSRILFMLINEAADAVYTGIATEQDVDLAMTKGVNYPKGLLQWGRDLGLQRVVQGLDALYQYYHEDRYRCSPWLRLQVNAEAARDLKAALSL